MFFQAYTDVFIHRNVDVRSLIVGREVSATNATFGDVSAMCVLCMCIMHYYCGIIMFL